jgi:hypothetical protein
MNDEMSPAAWPAQRGTGEAIGRADRVFPPAGASGSSDRLSTNPGAAAGHPRQDVSSLTYPGGPVPPGAFLAGWDACAA